MFKLFGKKDTPAPLSIRDTLFGDMPWTHFESKPNSEPWTSFAQAHKALNSNQKQQAIESLQKTTEMPGLESRHYVQAWHFLRQFGVQPPADKANFVYGVVVEVRMDKGLDLLAAYRDRSARYYNFSGAGVVWEHPNSSIDNEIDALLSAGQEVALKIGPWEQDRPPAPQKKDEARLNMLTPSGLYFGQGDLSVLSKDPLGAALVQSAVTLMNKLVDISLKNRQK